MSYRKLKIKIITRDFVILLAKIFFTKAKHSAKKNTSFRLIDFFWFLTTFRFINFRIFLIFPLS